MTIHTSSSVTSTLYLITHPLSIPHPSQSLGPAILPGFHEISIETSHINQNICCLPFCACLLSLNVMSFCAIHTAAKAGFLLSILE